MYCPKCGQSNPDDANFCSSCQHKIGEARAQQNAQQQQQQQQQQHQQSNIAMAANLKKMCLGGKVILASAILSIISLFMPWVDLGFYSQNGFDQQGYIFLIFFLYPVIMILLSKKLNRMIGFISAILGLIFNIYFISTKSVSFFGTTISAASAGLYLSAVTFIVLIAGIFLYRAE